MKEIICTYSNRSFTNYSLGNVDEINTTIHKQDRQIGKSNMADDFEIIEEVPKPQPEPKAHADFIRKLFDGVVRQNKDKTVLQSAELKDVQRQIAGDRSQTKGKKTIAGKLTPEEKAAFKQAESLRSSAQNAMKALDKLTGRELADALKGGGKPFEVLATAIKTQLSLADCLSKLARSTKSPALSQMAMRANLRAAELSRLAGEMSELTSAKVDAKPSAQAQLRTKGHSKDLSRIAADAQLNKAAVAYVEKQCEGARKLLDQFNAPDQPFDLMNLSEVKSAITSLKRSIAEALANGIDFKGDGSRTFVDPAVFKALTAELNAAANKLQNAQSRHVMDSLKGLVNGIELLKLGDSGQLSPYNSYATPEQKIAIRIHLRWISDLRVKTLQMLNGDCTPTERKDLLDELASQKFDEHVNGFGNCLPKLPVSDEQNEVLKENTKNAFGYTVAALTQVVKEIDRICKMTEERSKVFADGSDLNKLLFGEVGIADLAEAKVLGLNGDLIDTEVSGRKPVSVKPIGSGSFNAPKVCAFKLADGSVTERVFKPEAPALTMFRFSVIGKFLSGKSKRNVSQTNHASSKTAQMLHCEDVVVKTSIGHLNGVFGLFMEKATGSTPVDLTKKPNKGGGGASVNAIRQLQKTNPKLYKWVKAEVMRQLNRLQCLDLICGQLDRHSHNFLIHISKDFSQVRIKGIDNDQSFPDSIPKIGQFTIPSKKLSNNTESKLKKIVSNEEAERQINKALADNVIARTDKGELIVNDITKLSPEFRMAIADGTGLHSVTVPSCMDQEMFDAISALVKDQGTYRKELARNGLSQEQINAAVSRLQNLYDIGCELKKKNLVLNEAGWLRLDVTSIEKQTDYFVRDNVLQMFEAPSDASTGGKK